MIQEHTSILTAANVGLGFVAGIVLLSALRFARSEWSYGNRGPAVAALFVGLVISAGLYAVIVLLNP